METAGRGVQQRDIRDLCRFYGLSAAIRDELMRLAEEARRPGWWQDFRSLDEQTASFVGLESAALESRQFVALYLPGLLQTEAYARALVSRVRPPQYWAGDEIDQLVRMRIGRQRRVHSGDLALFVIVDEAAFARPVGSSAVMLEQVEHLARVARLPNVVFQVVPFTAGPHPGLDGSFRHLRFHPENLTEVVYIEGLLGNFLLDKPAEVARYLEIFDYISTSVALPGEASLTWLDQLRVRLDLPDQGGS